MWYSRPFFLTITNAPPLREFEPVLMYMPLRGPAMTSAYLCPSTVRVFSPAGAFLALVVDSAVVLASLSAAENDVPVDFLLAPVDFSAAVAPAVPSIWDEWTVIGCPGYRLLVQRT